MKIVRNNKRADQFRDFLREDFAKPRVLSPVEVHVSELLAPRKAYWTRLLGERVTDEMIGLFATGEAFHLMLQKVAGVEYAEHEVKHCGVVGHCDLRPPDNEDTEIKTSRKWSVPADPEPRYVDQITAYMAMGDTPIGHILVLYITAGRRWDGKKASTMELVSWQIDLDAEERAEIRNQLVAEKDRLLNAVKVKNPKLVDLCPEWQCASIYKGEVQSVCPFYENECKPEGRYPIQVLAGDLDKQSERKPARAKSKRTQTPAQGGRTQTPRAQTLR